MEPVIAVSVTAVMVIYALLRKSLTVKGVLAAILTAAIHAVHPWSIFFTLLITFFLAGTLVTKVKHNYKSTLTSSAAGGSIPSAPHPRTHVQVFANSLPASILIVAHALFLDTQVHSMPGFLRGNSGKEISTCLPHPRPTTAFSAPNFLNAAPYGIIGMYAAMAADTFASELGILSREKPRLITNPLRTVPPGTNGAVTFGGVLASAAGALIIGIASLLMTPLCSGSESRLVATRTGYVHGYRIDVLTNERQWSLRDQMIFLGLITAWGTLGGLLDSLLGALLQASVIDVRSGKVIEGEGGVKVMVISDKGSDGKGGRKILVGKDVLSNNGVNLLMASIMAVGAVVAAGIYMGITPSKFISDVAQLYPTLQSRGWLG